MISVTHSAQLECMMRNAELPRLTLAEQIVYMPALLHRRWTEAEVRQLIADAGPTPRYELVGGELLVTPAPSDMHQRIVFELAKRIDAFVLAQRLGEVRLSPSDIRLAPKLVVQPDLYVVPSSAGRRPRTDVRTTQVLLAVEVISPSSAHHDRAVKRPACQEAGVPEYWIVEAEAGLIERWRPEAVRPEMVHGMLTWSPPGASEPFTLDAKQFFADMGDD